METRQYIYDQFPDAKSAVESGGNWEYEPETAEYADAIFLEDGYNGSGRWYQYYLVYGFSVDAGRLQYDLWRCWDGDWDMISSGPIEEYDRSQKATVDDCARSHRDYAQWVMDNGADPLGEYYVRRNVEKKERWTFNLIQCVGCVRLHSVKRGRKTYQQMDFRNLPAHVLLYIGLGNDHKIKDIKTLDELQAMRQENNCARFGGNGRGVISDLLTHNAPRAQHIVARELRKLAKRTLEQA